MYTKKLLKNSILYCTAILAVVLFFIGCDNANAATLQINSNSTNISIGDTAILYVVINSDGVSVNNAEAIIKFPTELVDVISINKSGSVFSLWVEEPSFSNSSGIITLNGGVPTPGFNGTRGSVLSIAVRAKKSGQAEFVFFSGAVRANDGLGTDVLRDEQGKIITISEKIIIPSPAIGTPPATEINSPTHPDSNNWYSNNAPLFKWQITSDITGVRLLVDKNPLSIPTVPYGSISEKNLEKLDDGTWYFHVQLQNSSGWGQVANYKFQIDTTPPLSFKVGVKDGSTTTNSQPTLAFVAVDETSGINHYEILIDQKPSIQTEESEYKLSPLEPESHTIVIKAVDRAGNVTLAMTEISILSIESPVITEYPQTLAPNSILVLKGTSLPVVTINIYMQNSKNEIITGETKSDGNGNWFYAGIEPLPEGPYKIWAESIDSTEGKSKPSNKISILVSTPVFIRIGQMAINYLTVIITLLILVFAIVFGGLWGWEKIKRKQKKVRKETAEAERAVYVAFKDLREEIEKQVAKIDGQKGLNEKEKKISTELKKALDDSEKFIGKEVKDIMDELD